MTSWLSSREAGLLSGRPGEEAGRPAPELPRRRPAPEAEGTRRTWSVRPVGPAAGTRSLSWSPVGTAGAVGSSSAGELGTFSNRPPHAPVSSVTYRLHLMARLAGLSLVNILPPAQGEVEWALRG